jgi:hypothetical protein
VSIWLDYFIGFFTAVWRSPYYVGLYSPPGLHNAGIAWLKGKLAEKFGMSDEGTLEYWIANDQTGSRKLSNTSPFAEIDPKECGVPLATSWQYSGNKNRIWHVEDPDSGKTLPRLLWADLDTSIYQDPGLGE